MTIYINKIQGCIKIKQGSDFMTLKEAKGIYSTLLREYNTQKSKLAKQKKELDEKIKNTKNGVVVYAEEAATLELTYNAVSKKQDEYQAYLNQLMLQWDAAFNKAAAAQQADAAGEYGREIGKILTIARRIMHGDIVPIKDEKKLMEYSIELYQMAKNIGMMVRNHEKRKYKSLWEDEEKKEYQDPAEAADSLEVTSSGPEAISVEDTMAAATKE